MLSASLATYGLLTIFLIVSEALPVFFVLRPRELNSHSQKIVDWLVGLLGASLPLLVLPSDAQPLLPEAICGAIMLNGIYIQISAKLILGRSFGIVAANRGIKVRGPYRIIRHPIYAGYTITHIGFLLAFPSLWNAIVYLTVFAIQLARLHREELLLTKDKTYRDYATSVRYRLLPMIY
jgi:protein-S-isoprenylcysteine O-methyltransferase Ste14